MYEYIKLIKVTLPLVALYLFQNVLAVYYLFQTFSRSIKDRVKIKHQLQSINSNFL